MLAHTPLAPRVSDNKSIHINVAVCNISGNPTCTLQIVIHTHTHTHMYMYTYNRCSNKVSDIQGSICRISSQACAGESSRSGTANVLRNALIWKSRSSTLLYEKPSPQIQTPYCTTMALVDTTAQDSGENLSARLSQSC